MVKVRIEKFPEQDRNWALGYENNEATQKRTIKIPEFDLKVMMPLLSEDIPKEVEPTSYLHFIMKLG